MNNHQHELPIPPDANSSANARELLRVWAAKGKQHVSLATGLWQDPGTWGIMLVDLMKHVALAYEETQGLPVGETLKRVKAGFDAEWNQATDSPSGGLMR